MTSGVRVSETRVATRSPTARPSGESGPTSSTVPTSMPPGAGLGVLHLAAARRRSSSTAARTASPSTRRRGVGALELAERRGVEVEPLDPDPHLVGPQLAAGVEALGGLGQHQRAVEHPVQAGRIALTAGHDNVPPSVRSLDRKIFRRVDVRDRTISTPSLADRRGRPTTDAPPPTASRESQHEHRDLDRRLARPASPTPTGASSSSSPTGPASPAGATSPPSRVGLGAVAARALRQERQAAARAARRPGRRPLLRRPRARPGRAGHHVDAGAAADDEHDGAARRRRRARAR